MQKKLIILTLTLLAIGVCSCGESDQHAQDKATIDSKPMDASSAGNSKQTEGNELDPGVYAESKYTDAEGNDVIFQNSFPKGGVYIDSSGILSGGDTTGIRYGYGVFWTRLINETTKPVEMTLNFPTDSLVLASSPGVYFRLFLPPDTMTVDKLSRYSYGISDLASSLAAGFEELSMLERTVDPNDDFYFYVLLFFQAPKNGPVRTGFVVKDQDLFYKIDIEPYGSTLIPCGQFVFKNR